MNSHPLRDSLCNDILRNDQVKCFSLHRTSAQQVKKGTDPYNANERANYTIKREEQEQKPRNQRSRRRGTHASSLADDFNLALETETTAARLSQSYSCQRFIYCLLFSRVITLNYTSEQLKQHAQNRSAVFFFYQTALSGAAEVKQKANSKISAKQKLGQPATRVRQPSFSTWRPLCLVFPPNRSVVLQGQLGRPLRRLLPRAARAWHVRVLAQLGFSTALSGFTKPRGSGSERVGRGRLRRRGSGAPR